MYPILYKNKILYRMRSNIGERHLALRLVLAFCASIRSPRCLESASAPAVFVQGATCGERVRAVHEDALPSEPVALPRRHQERRQLLQLALRPSRAIGLRWRGLARRALRPGSPASYDLWSGMSPGADRVRSDAGVAMRTSPIRCWARRGQL